MPFRSAAPPATVTSTFIEWVPSYPRSNTERLALWYSSQGNTATSKLSLTRVVAQAGASPPPPPRSAPPVFSPPALSAPPSEPPLGE